MIYTKVDNQGGRVLKYSATGIPNFTNDPNVVYKNATTGATILPANYPFWYQKATDNNKATLWAGASTIGVPSDNDIKIVLEDGSGNVLIGVKEYTTNEDEEDEE